METHEGQFARTERLLGEAALERLRKSAVAVFGLGGVGGFAAEALARAGVGRLVLVDGDTVGVTNLNRQLVALHSTLGKPKAELMAQRAKDISPDVRAEAHVLYYGPDTKDALPLPQMDCIVDAVDMVSAKLLLAEEAARLGVPIVSCMGTGNKMEPSLLCAADIKDTSVCPLARVMRRELKKRGIESLRVVYSPEAPIRAHAGDDPRVPASAPFVPPAAGFLLAREALRFLCG